MGAESLERVHELPRLPARPGNSNKGTFGRVLVIAGSRGMSGAAVLAGSAALRAGAGLVTVACPEPIWPQVAVGNPCYTTRPQAADEGGRLSFRAETELLELAAKNDVVAVGPGLGQSDDIAMLVRSLLKTTKPLVIDADGLNVLEGLVDELKRSAPLVITPHPGEFGRLIGKSPGAVQAQREELAVP
ncbi:MAG: NAD(P)H-hydrate dehydratase, partial [Gemmataceae bacterium]